MLKKLRVWLFLSAIILGSCTSHESGQDPIPKSRVEVRVTGTDIGGLGAAFEFSVKPAQRQQELYLSSTVDEGTVTRSMGDWDTTSEAILLVKFNNVNHTSIIQPKTSSLLKGELLINGQVKANVVLNKNTVYSSTGYPANSTSILIGN